MRDLFLAAENLLRHRDDFVVIGLRRVDDGQFCFPFDLRIVFGLAFSQSQHALLGQHIREQLAEQEQDNADVNHPDADLAAREMKPAHVRCNEIQQQHAADEVATRQNRKLPGRALWSPKNKQAAEEFVLRLVKPQLHLGQSAGENKNKAQKQANDGESERAEEINDTIQKARECEFRVNVLVLRGAELRLQPASLIV